MRIHLNHSLRIANEMVENVAMCIYVPKSKLYSWQKATCNCECMASVIDELNDMQHWWYSNDREKPTCSENTCPSATLSTTSPILRGLGLNSRPPRWKAGDIRLSRVYYQNSRLKIKCSAFIYCFMNGKWAGLLARIKSRKANRIFGRRYSS
jgi:hypothetical protein